MPIYLCKPGWSMPEPWRHGLQVYAYPFPIDEIPTTRSVPAPPDQSKDENRQDNDLFPSSNNGLPIRRIRHAEVILVDEVCSYFGRYWLRLRWPGSHGGFAGYIALGCVDKERDDVDKHMEDQENTPTTSNESKSMLIRCKSTGLYFPSSSAMELLYRYDDGLYELMKEQGQGIDIDPLVTGMGDEPVFCRICREGIHDISYDLDPTPETNQISDHTTHNPQPRPNRSDDEGSPAPTTQNKMSLLHQATSSHPTAENPILAPCECSGSIAFVHYLCIEQWRCRSRHPNARNGLNCETCGAEYTLPPPPNRPEREALDDDWLEAMPAHVLAALRRPHFWWSVGASLVRHRRLRPFVPIVVSPIVALYCRARRTLKKRGVSRRRWACSLCRRRARWKCVRCLRSYYCSRQCQNVSWHIVHKHVCYKPVRFWWSVVFYTVLLIAIVPGIIRNPLVYGTGLASIPLSFLLVGILSGYLASSMKKLAKVDIRGRFLEMAVVLCTVKVAYSSWAIIQAFFGISTDKCSAFPCTSLYSTSILKLAHTTILYPLHHSLTYLDQHIKKIFFLNITLCQKDQQFCLATIQKMSDSNLLDKCQFDSIVLFILCSMAVLVSLSSFMLRKNRGEVRQQRGRPVIIQRIGRQRPHQD